MRDRQERQGNPEGDLCSISPGQRLAMLVGEGFASRFSILWRPWIGCGCCGDGVRETSRRPPWALHAGGRDVGQAGSNGNVNGGR